VTAEEMAAAIKVGRMLHESGLKFDQQLTVLAAAAKALMLIRDEAKS
jgi:hypothetical protein